MATTFKPILRSGVTEPTIEDGQVIFDIRDGEEKIQVDRSGTRKTVANLGGAIYTHEQNIAADVWNIQHNLGSIGVSAVFIDSDGNEFETFIDRPASTNNLLVSRHGTLIAGKAYIKL